MTHLAERLTRLASLGLSGVRCLGLEQADPDAWRALVARVRSSAPDFSLLAWTPGTAFATRVALAGAGFDGCFSSFAWWDLQERWFLEEAAVQNAFPLQIAAPRRLLPSAWRTERKAPRCWSAGRGACCVSLRSSAAG